MKIQNHPQLSHEALLSEINQGARFIHFPYVISFLITSMKKESGVYMLRPGERIFFKALPFIITTFVFGWWALPSGPRHSIRALRANFRGGKDVTGEVTDTITGFLLFREAEQLRAS